MPTYQSAPTTEIAGEYATYDVHVNSPDSVHISAGHYPNARDTGTPTDVIINGVAHHLRATVVREGSPDFNPRLDLGGGWSWAHVRLTRVDAFRNGRYDDSPSDSARKKVREDLARVVAQIPAELLFEAGDVRRANAIITAQATVAEAEAKLAEAQANLAALLAAEEVSV